MGSCHSVVISSPPYTSFPSYKGAGILFLEGPVALAGIQKYPKVLKGAKAVLSGLGGHREPSDEDWCHTAWREVIEELFHVPTVPLPLLRELRTAILFQHPPIFSQDYVLLRLGFGDLTKVLALCRKHKIQSELYKTMPLTVNDLILERCLQSSAEIGVLALIPSDPYVTIAPEFSSDLNMIKTQL